MSDSGVAYMATNAVHTPASNSRPRALLRLSPAPAVRPVPSQGNVMRLHPIQLLLGLNAGGDGHQAVKATRYCSCVVVLGVVVHKFPDGLRTPLDRMRSQISSS